MAMAYIAALHVQVPEVLAGLDVQIVRQPFLKLGDDDFFVVGFLAEWRLVLKRNGPISLSVFEMISAFVMRFDSSLLFVSIQLSLCRHRLHKVTSEPAKGR